MDLQDNQMRALIDPWIEVGRISQQILLTCALITGLEIPFGSRKTAPVNLLCIYLKRESTLSLLRGFVKGQCYQLHQGFRKQALYQLMATDKNLTSSLLEDAKSLTMAGLWREQVYGGNYLWFVLVS